MLMYTIPSEFRLSSDEDDPRCLHLYLFSPAPRLTSCAFGRQDGRFSHLFFPAPHPKSPVLVVGIDGFAPCPPIYSLKIALNKILISCLFEGFACRNQCKSCVFYPFFCHLALPFLCIYGKILHCRPLFLYFRLCQR